MIHFHDDGKRHHDATDEKVGKRQWEKKVVCDILEASICGDGDAYERVPDETDKAKDGKE